MFDFHFDLLDKHILQYQNLGKNFTVKRSKFSATIILQNGKKIKYGKKSIRVSAFGYFQTLKKELSNSLEFFEPKKIENVEFFYSDSDLFFEVLKLHKEKEIGYFLINENFENLENEKIYNIDISSAYLYALKNSGKISDAIFKKIFSLDKLSRLVCLGLLAYEPVFFNYENGKIENVEILKNEFRNVFFYCVREIFYLSKLIKKKIGTDFVFSWVDGFYFKGEKNIQLIENILKSKRYKFKTYRLFKFSIEKKQNFHIFEYLKKEKKEIELKKICVPLNVRNKNNLFFQTNEAIKDNDEEKFNLLINKYLC